VWPTNGQSLPVVDGGDDFFSSHLSQEIFVIAGKNRLLDGKLTGNRLLRAPGRVMVVQSGLKFEDVALRNICLSVWLYVFWFYRPGITFLITI
jgi:hypothetical protein